MDVMTAISALCNAPEAPIAEGACSAVMASGGLEIMVAVSNAAESCQPGDVFFPILQT